MLVGTALTACIKNQKHVGYLFDLPALEKLRHREDVTKDEVLAALGSPSATSEFGDESWYYISNRYESKAFLLPKAIERRVIVFNFDETGHMKEMQELDAKDAQNIEFAKDFTPTEGHNLGLMEQLFGNIGRFNTAPNNKLPGQH